MAGFLLSGCAGLGPTADKITPADTVPEFTGPLVTGPITQGQYTLSDRQGDLKLILSPGQGFILRRSHNGCALAERRGEWSGDQDSLHLHIRDIRSRSSCEAKWELRPNDSSLVCPIRIVAGHPLPFLAQEGPGRGMRWQKLARINTAGVLMEDALPAVPTARKKRFSTSSVFNGKQSRSRS